MILRICSLLENDSDRDMFDLDGVIQTNYVATTYIKTELFPKLSIRGNL